MTAFFSKYLRAIVATAFLTGMAASLSSCFEGLSDNSSREPLEISRTKIVTGRSADEDYIGITARNAGWTLSGDKDWCRVSQSSGEAGTTVVTISFLENPDETSREATFVIVSGSMRKEIPVEQLAVDIVPDQDPEAPVNKYIYENIINEWYYWSGETANTPADYNQPTFGFFDNYLMTLEENDIDGNSWSNNDRYLYSYLTRTPKAEIGRAPLNYGMEFQLSDYRVSQKMTMVARVLYVMDKSPAQVAGIKRGEWFYKVNDVQLGNWEESSGWMQYNRLIDSLVRPVAGESPKLGMLTFRSFASELIDDRRSVTVTPAPFHGNPILYSQIIRRTEHGVDTRTGYLVYNSFDPQYRSELVKEFEKFKTENITHVVLDLRYNKTGTVEMAELMANLIVPPSMDGEVFAKYEFNGKHGTKTVNLLSDPGSAGLSTVFILTSEHTAGASELLINSLRGLDGMTLVVIGDTTEGMNTGMIERTYDTDEYQYRVWPVAFRCYNAMDEGDYHWGFTPNVTPVNEFEDKNAKWPATWGWKGTVGATEDPLLFEAMQLIVGNKAMPTDRVAAGTMMRRKSGYQRLFSVRARMTMEEVPE
jgi:C-terminal processing protease CtpA/Prc